MQTNADQLENHEEQWTAVAAAAQDQPDSAACTTDDTKTLAVTVRLIDADSVEEKQIKILSRVHVSHFLKILSWSFNKIGFYNQDFDSFLIQNEIEIQMNHDNKVSDYQIKNDDIVEVRRKKLLISVKLNIHQEDVREYQVNASIPVQETIKSLGSMLGINNTKELSLALPVMAEKTTATVSSVNWLDPLKSLNAQGVTEGDTIMIRKKFFVFNEDIGEAKHNPVLRDLLFHQLQNQLSQTKDTTSTTRKVSLAYSFGIPSEASDLDSLSDNEGCVLETSSFLADVMSSLERSRNESNSESVKEEWIQSLSKNSDLKSFSIKTTAHTEAKYLFMKSREICLTSDQCYTAEGVVQKWNSNEISKWEKFENGIVIHMSDQSSHTIFSEQSNDIADHLLFVTQKEASNGKQADQPSTVTNDSNSCHTNHVPTLSPAQSLPDSLKGIIDGDTNYHSKESSLFDPVEEAGVTKRSQDSILSSSGAEATSVSNMSLSSPFHPPPTKKENTTNIIPPAYFGLTYKELLDTHLLMNIIVLDQDIREILVDVTKPVKEVIKDICTTYGIQYPEEHYLRYPESTEQVFEKYGGKPRLDSLSGEFRESSSSLKCNVILDPKQPLVEQLHFDIQPVVLLLRRHNFDEVDAVEKYSLEIGNEWPDGEDPGVAKYRYFYQSWMSVQQGYTDVDKQTAIKLAAILTFLYHGSVKTAAVWPPIDFDPKCFLPRKYQNIMGIEKDILKCHKKYGDVQVMEAIEDVIRIINDEVTQSKGIRFTVKVPTRSDILKMKKLEQRTFCISKDGIACVSNCGRKDKCLTKSYSDISNWATSDTSFSLSFGDNQGDFFCYTYQAGQIMEMIQLFVKMAYNNIKSSPKRSIGSMSDV